MIEEWRDIEGFDGFYQVSNTGKVRSCCNGGRVGGKGEWRLRALSANHDGYLKVRLEQGGKDLTKRVHTLVAEAFLPNPHGYNTVNHKDGNKTNNVVDNLEWADRSEQMIHAYKLGLKTPIRGSKNSQAKLTDEDVRYIRSHYKRLDREFGTVALGRKFGLTNAAVGKVVRGETYQDVK